MGPRAINKEARRFNWRASFAIVLTVLFWIGVYQIAKALI